MLLAVNLRSRSDKSVVIVKIGIVPNGLIEKRGICAQKLLNHPLHEAGYNVNVQKDNSTTFLPVGVQSASND
jgi:hypothetical protein